MSDVQPNQTWWRASDGKWYPPELHADYTPFQTPTPPPAQSGPTTVGTAGSGPAAMAANNAKGVAGEQATAAELATLPSSYRVFHGLKIGSTKGDIDHLVIGPTGIWVIDSKAWSGALTEGKGMLWRGSTPIRKEIASVERQASYARDVLGCDTNPMLCFVGTNLPRPAQMVGRTRVLTLDALVPHLANSTRIFAAHQVDAAFAAAQRWKTQPPAIAVPPAAGPAKQSRVRPTAPSLPLASPGQHQTTATPSSKTAGPLQKLLGIMLALILLGSALTFAGQQLISMVPKGPTGTRGAGQGVVTPIVPAGEPGQPNVAPSSIPDPRYFTAEVECPTPGGGYTVKGRSGKPSGKIRVTSIQAGTSQFLGELSYFAPIPPLTAIPPSSAVGLDIQALDSSGQIEGEPYHLEIQTPNVPC